MNGSPAVAPVVFFSTAWSLTRSWIIYIFPLNSEVPPFENFQDVAKTLLILKTQINIPCIPLLSLSLKSVRKEYPRFSNGFLRLRITTLQSHCYANGIYPIPSRLICNEASGSKYCNHSNRINPNAVWETFKSSQALFGFLCIIRMNGFSPA